MGLGEQTKGNKYVEKAQTIETGREIEMVGNLVCFLEDIAVSVDAMCIEVKSQTWAVKGVDTTGAHVKADEKEISMDEMQGYKLIGRVVVAIQDHEKLSLHDMVRKAMSVCLQSDNERHVVVLAALSLEGTDAGYLEVAEPFRSSLVAACRDKATEVHEIQILAE